MLIKTYNDLSNILRLNEKYLRRPRLVFENGFSVSIQAGSGMYCSPRRDKGPYSDLEIGYPSDIVDEWSIYMDGNPEITDPTSTVYPYVPVLIIVDFLKMCGDCSIDEKQFFAFPAGLDFEFPNFPF